MCDRVEKYKRGITRERFVGYGKSGPNIEFWDNI